MQRPRAVTRRDALAVMRLTVQIWQLTTESAASTLPIARARAFVPGDRSTAVVVEFYMINTLYLPELREMLELGDADGLREFCTALHPARTAEFMEGLTAAESWTVLQAADPPTRVEIFGYLDRQKQIEIIETCDPESVSTLDRRHAGRRPRRPAERGRRGSRRETCCR